MEENNEWFIYCPLRPRIYGGKTLLDAFESAWKLMIINRSTLVRIQREGKDQRPKDASFEEYSEFLNQQLNNFLNA